MPTPVEVPELVPTQLEDAPLPAASAKWSPSYALAAVVENFNLFSRYRQINHDRRWTVNDSLYYGNVPQRNWEGTSTPRANIPYKLSFSQIHAVKPIIINALFGTAGDYFSVEPLPGTAGDEAVQLKARMTYALEHPYDDFGGNALNEFKHAIHQTLVYGNGGVMIQYDPTAKMPVIEWCDIRNVYFDPGAATPDIESSRAVIYRKLYTIDELEAMRGSDGMSIPSRQILYSMANERPVSWGDVTTRTAEALRLVSYNPNADTVLPSPADRFVECLIYYSKSRIVWILDRKWVAYNEKNPLGFLPFAFAPCYTVPGRFYAQSIPEVLEPSQRICEALLNGRLDEISLSLNPPRVRKRGSVLSPSQLKFRPGALVESENPKEDFIRQEPQQITTNVFQEVGFFQNVAREDTGANAAITSGMPLASNASRTNSGIAMQNQGPMSRLSEIIDNIENFLIVPTLYKMQKMMEHYESFGQDGYSQTLPGYENGAYTQVSSTVLSKPCRFKILAASKMLSREKLAQMFPFVAQTLFSGQFLANLHQLGQTVDINEIMRMFKDATGTSNAYAFVRPMTPEEQQQLNAPPPQAQMQMQMKQQDAQVRKDIADKKNQTELTKAALAHHAAGDKQAEASALKLLELLNTQKQAEQGLLTPPPSQLM